MILPMLVLHSRDVLGFWLYFSYSYTDTLFSMFNVIQIIAHMSIPCPNGDAFVSGSERHIVEIRDDVLQIVKDIDFTWIVLLPKLINCDIFTIASKYQYFDIEVIVRSGE